MDIRQFRIRYHTVTGRAVNSIDSWMTGSEPRQPSHAGIIDTLCEFVYGATIWVRLAAAI